MRVPDRIGVVAGYRVWRVLPGRWIAPSDSLHARSGHSAWSLAGPTVARCPSRVQADPRKPLLVGGPCGEASPGYGCSCGLYARYEPEGRLLLPYVAGSVLAWGRVIHHAGRSFFRAEKALPVAFVRPRGGGGLFTEEAEEKLYRIAEELGAEVVEGPKELREYTEQEASAW